MNFAIIENDLVINVIVAESASVAEALFPNATVVEETAETGSAVVNGTWDASAGKLIPRQPYPSWVLNGSTNTWEAPVPMPVDDKGYDWDEDSVSWKVIWEPETPAE